MIAIINVSDEDAPETGVNQYQLRINRQLICEFEHHRRPNGLAQCLRDAADAVEFREDCGIDWLCKTMGDL